MKKNRLIDRRSFMKMIAVGTCGAACHQVLSPGAMVAYAAAPSGPVKRFIEIFFYGGVCTYGMFPQFNVGARSRYPTLGRTPDQAVSLNHPDIGMHLAFAPFVAEAGLAHLAVVIGVANLDPSGRSSRSHEEGQNAAQRINQDYTAPTALGVGAAIAQEIGHPYALLSFDGASDFSQGGAIPPRSVSNLSNSGKPNFSQSQWYNLIEGGTRALAPAPGTEEAKYIVASIQGMEQNIQTLRGLSQLPLAVQFPNTGIGNRFRDATRMIAANLGSVFFVPFGGFDTHSNQAAQHNTLFGQLNAALVPLIQNLKAIPGVAAPTAWDETVIVMRSDFPRTFENNAAGTDHGFTGNQFLVGGPIRGGIYGDPPDAARYQNERGSYMGPSWVQFNAGESTKEIVRIGMGLAVNFPTYVGNRYAPIGFLR